MGISLPQTASTSRTGAWGLTLSQALGIQDYSLPNWSHQSGLKTDLDDDQAGPPALTTVVRQGPASAGWHSAGESRAKPGCSSLREVQPLGL